MLADSRGSRGRRRGERICAQDPPSTGLMARANVSYERGEFVEAAQQYEALIDRRYSDAALYFNLGNAYLESGDLGSSHPELPACPGALSPRLGHKGQPGTCALHDRWTASRGKEDSLVESVSYFGHRWTTPDELGTAALLLWVATANSHRGSPGVAGLTPKARVARLLRPLRLWLR